MTLSSEQLFSALDSLLGSKNWFHNSEKLKPYLTPSTGTTPKNSTLAVTTPTSVGEVQKLVQFCSQHRLAITPQGGNTGRCEGAIPQNPNGIILSLEKLCKVRSIEPKGKTAVVDAGIVLDTLNHQLEEHRLQFPIALGASGSCQVGGNIATNAGGINALKYGTTRQSILGLEAVLADGSLYQHLSPLYKDNRGYNINQLLIGSEGTLGIITGASLKLVPQQQQQFTYLLSASTINNVLDILAIVQQQTDHHLCAAEVISNRAITQMLEVYPDISFPLPKNQPWYFLLEVASTLDNNEQAQILDTILEQALMQAFEQQKTQYITKAQNQEQRKALWCLRERIVAAPLQLNTKRRYVRSDVAVPIHQLPSLFRLVEKNLTKHHKHFKSFPYGHIADGNIHYNFYTEHHLTTTDFILYSNQLTSFLMETVRSLGGTFSAEHGIGSTKMNALMADIDDNHLRLFINIKRAFDPMNILNPNTVLSSSALS